MGWMMCDMVVDKYRLVDGLNSVFRLPILDFGSLKIKRDSCRIFSTFAINGFIDAGFSKESAHL